MALLMDAIIYQLHTAISHYEMSWADPQSFLSALMGPNPIAILIAAVLVLSVPLFLHLVIYRSTTATTLPAFLLLGPSGSGKTALLTLVGKVIHIKALTKFRHSLNVVDMLRPGRRRPH